MVAVSKRTRDGRSTWWARWRDPDGQQHNKSFARKAEADRYAVSVGADLVRGEYLDPRSGDETLKSYAERWLGAQTFDPSTREAVELRLRLHILPGLGSTRLRSLKPSTVQGWLRGLEGHLAPTTTRLILVHLSTILSAAVDDDLIRRNPCAAGSVRAPRRDTKKVVPWPVEDVLAVQAALPDRYRIAATLAAGLGLRQGEVFGLSPDDVDFLRGVVTVQRQVKVLNSRLVLALPKGGKTRQVPLPASVRTSLAAHLHACPARPVTLPWGDTIGPATTVALVLTTRESKAMNRTYVNPSIWKPALVDIGRPATRDNGMHALRHFYASVLLDAGESIKAVSEYLGHADAGFTLRTYTHLMPTSAERTRKAVDSVLGQSSGDPNVIPKLGQIR